MAKNFRQLFYHLTPSWLHTGEGELVLHTLAMMKDAFSERVLQGLESRFPSRAGATALALLGDDRGIIRGRNETSEHYAQRLIRWRWPRGHRVRGSAFAALEQISEYFGGIECWSIDVKGNRHVRDADGVETYSYGYPWNWDGAGATPAWARFWVVITPPEGVTEHPDFGDPDLWGGALGNQEYTIGQTGITRDDVNAICRLFARRRSWKPAGTTAEWVILDLDGGSPTLDGTWLNWSQNVSGTQKATRYAGWRFWALHDDLKDYVGDASNFPTKLDMPDGTTYTPTPSYSATYTMPDGSVYTPNPNNFPSSIRLLDDGDIPQ